MSCWVSPGLWEFGLTPTMPEQLLSGVCCPHSQCEVGVKFKCGSQTLSGTRCALEVDEGSGIFDFICFNSYTHPVKSSRHSKHDLANAPCTLAFCTGHRCLGHGPEALQKVLPSRENNAAAGNWQAYTFGGGFS